MATIVLDTSAVLHDLEFVQDLVKAAPSHFVDVLLPRELLKELDKIKDRPSQNPTLQTKARQAINWINSILAFQNPDEPLLRGQKLSEVVVPNLSADEAILDCALYNQKATGKTTILLSEDHNLCNRALIDGIETLETKSAFSQRGVSVDKVFEAIYAKSMLRMDIDAEHLPAMHAHTESNDAETGLNSVKIKTAPNHAVTSLDGHTNRSESPASTETPADIPPPIVGQNLENEIKANISQLIDWHVHQKFTDDELVFLKYKKPQTSRNFASVLSQFGFSFDAKLPAKFLADFQRVIKGDINKEYVSKHVELMMRLAKSDHRYKLLLHKYDQDAMVDV